MAVSMAKAVVSYFTNNLMLSNEEMRGVHQGAVLRL